MNLSLYHPLGPSVHVADLSKAVFILAPGFPKWGSQAPGCHGAMSRRPQTKGAHVQFFVRFNKCDFNKSYLITEVWLLLK